MPEENQSPRVLDLFNRIAGEKDYFQRLKVMTAVITSSGAKLEGQKRGREAVEEWIKLNPVLKKITESDPDDAVNFGIWLTTLPVVADTQHEWENRWHRGNGLVILANDGVRYRTSQELSKNKSLRETVENFMDFDPTKVSIMGDLAEHPEAFAMVTDLKLVLGLDGLPVADNVHQLINKAKSIIGTPQVKVLVKLFGQITDTVELYKFFVRNGYTT